jgi:hypothetical protein
VMLDEVVGVADREVGEQRADPGRRCSVPFGKVLLRYPTAILVAQTGGGVKQALASEHEQRVFRLSKVVPCAVARDVKPHVFFVERDGKFEVHVAREQSRARSVWVRHGASIIDQTQTEHSRINTSTATRTSGRGSRAPKTLLAGPYRTVVSRRYLPPSTSPIRVSQPAEGFRQGRGR